MFQVELISILSFLGGIGIDLIDCLKADLATHEHFCDQVNVLMFLEKILVDNEICESKLEKSHIVLRSLLLYRLHLVLVFKHLSRIAHLLLQWLVHMIRNCRLVIGRVIISFVGSVIVYDRYVVFNRLRLSTLLFFLFLALLLRFLHEDTQPNFLPKLRSFCHQP